MQKYRDRALGLIFDRLRHDSGVSRAAIINDRRVGLSVSRESLHRWVV